MQIQILDSTITSELTELVCELLKELGWVYKRSDVYVSLNQLFSCGHFECYGLFHRAKLVGALGVLATPDLWLRDRYTAHETFWYVYPAYRGKASMKLLEYVELKTKADKIDFGIAPEPLQRLMQRRGYKKEKLILSKAL